MNNGIDNDLVKVEQIVKSYLPSEFSDLGKMIRVKLGILVLKCLDIELTEDIYKFLAVVELIHNASLFHDDVIDDEKIRRKKPSCNRVYGVKTAVLYGNIVLSSVLEILLEMGNTDLILKMNDCVKSMCEGELLQQEFLGEFPDIDVYIRKTILKTGSLFEYLMYGLSELSKFKDREKLCLIGRNFGIAFQLKNDLDDVYDDIKNGIYTACAIFSGSVNINPQAIDKTKGLIDNYLSEVYTAWDMFKDSEYKNSLIGVVECLRK